MRISQLDGRRVALWGWGREGRAAYRAVRARLPSLPLTLFCTADEAADAAALGDPALTVDNEFTYPVQINGKKRGDLTIARDADQAAVEKAALELDVVQKALDGKPPRKVIVVPQRIVNVVA